MGTSRIRKIFWDEMNTFRSPRNTLRPNERFQVPEKYFETNMNTFKSKKNICREEWTLKGLRNIVWRQNELFRVEEKYSKVRMNSKRSQKNTSTPKWALQDSEKYFQVKGTLKGPRKITWGQQRHIRVEEKYLEDRMNSQRSQENNLRPEWALQGSKKYFGAKWTLSRPLHVNFWETWNRSPKNIWRPKWTVLGLKKILPYLYHTYHTYSGQNELSEDPGK